jgi:hypothetical protein
MLETSEFHLAAGDVVERNWRPSSPYPSQFVGAQRLQTGRGVGGS